MPRLSFKVLTANVHKGFSLFNRRFILNELREAVRQVGADIVFLQEVLGSHIAHAKHVANWPTVPQYEFLADSIWPNFAYGQNAVYPDGHHGNALLSKFPIARYDNHDFSVAGDEKRGILHAVLREPAAGCDIHVFCIHFGLTEAHRSGQLLLLNELIQTAVPSDAPLIVAGDFNDWRLKVHAMLTSHLGLHEVFVRAYGAAARTFPATLPVLRLDRIYVRNAEAHAPVALPRKPWAHLSDHAPLVAEIHI
ncbi:MAG TPA: endonuclease/exonuclease/phosphatase family protein [Steroidobacteraceae bacterium]|nr:endonuclease/exonuclease/phosphatase family protein [Steroidobacteraceae bacterium]